VTHKKSTDPRSVLRPALRRGAPSTKAVANAVCLGGLARLSAVALVGGATALLVWSSARPGLGAVAGLLLAVELVAFARAPLRHAERVGAHDLGLDGLVGWRTWLLDSVASWAPSRMAAARSGDLLARCLADADRLQDLWVRVLVPAGASALALLVTSLVLAALVPLAGLGVLIAGVVVGVGAWLSARRIAALGVAESALRGAIAGRVVEYVQGIDALVLLRANEEHLAATAALSHRADTLEHRRTSASGAVVVLATFATACAVVNAAIAVKLPAANPSLAAGVVVAVLATGELLVSLASSLDGLSGVAGSTRRLGELGGAATSGSSSASHGPLVLHEVGVAAALGEPSLLDGVELTVSPGTLVAITGPTGTGKSALLGVAARLERPTAGSVTLAADSLDEIDESSLRRAVAWLPTHPRLLDGRVRDVLDVGRGLSDPVLAGALASVGLTEVLEPRGGLEAHLGVGGSELSGGEARRLALARLLAGAPSVLVLDEPTAGLDDRAVTTVLDTLDASGAAVLVATHDERVTSRAGTVRVTREGRLA
jgi:ATP-binding cassette, subfamily C, bacterial CydC